MRKAPYKREKLTPQEQRQWEDTLAALSWIGPGFIHVIYTMLANSGHRDVALFTNQLQHTAATDGYQLIFNPKRFFAHPLMERCFIVLHETMHEILNHVRLGYAFRVKGKITLGTRELPYEHDFANIVQDLVINAILIESKLGKYNPAWLYNPAMATDQDQWIEVYFRHYKQQQKLNLPPGFDITLDPEESKGSDPQEVPPRQDVQWEIVVKQAMEIQQAQGKMPASLKMFFEEILRPKVDWRDHIRGEIVRLAGSGAYDWRRLDRRLIVRGIGAPGMSGHGAGLIIVGGDSSGSIFQDPGLVARFIGEVGGMVEDVQPEETHVVWCDTEVKRVDICTDAKDVRKMVYDGVPGGGGTDFRPVFDYIAKNDLRPDMMIYLTDGAGTFPKRAPDFPVVWGNITPGQTYPFGTVVFVPTDPPED